MKLGNRKGFTLIELLVVIAIIAVLAVVVILSLNPAELLRQARDSNRVSDLSTLKSALSLFQADVSTSSPSALGTWQTLYLNSGVGINLTSTYNNSVSAAPVWWGYQIQTVNVLATGTSRAVNGTGWVPTNFNAISSGAPIGSLPVDPLNTASNSYAFAASSTVFKLATKMESTKFGLGGTGDVVSTDGGNSSTTFEAGTSLTAL